MIKRILFITISLALLVNMPLTAPANTQATNNPVTILTPIQLTKMGYKQTKKLTYSAMLCDRYEGDSTANKTYQGIKSRQALPQQKNTYYRFTLIKEVFDSPASAAQRLQRVSPPYAFKTDSLYEKMCALKQGFVIHKTVYFVATDAYLFNQELSKVLVQLKQHLTHKTKMTTVTSTALKELNP